MGDAHIPTCNNHRHHVVEEYKRNALESYRSEHTVSYTSAETMLAERWNTASHEGWKVERETFQPREFNMSSISCAQTLVNHLASVLSN